MQVGKVRSIPGSEWSGASRYAGLATATRNWAGLLTDSCAGCQVRKQVGQGAEGVVEGRQGNVVGSSKRPLHS